MDAEDIKILKLKYRTMDKLLRPAVERVKLLAGAIQDAFRTIADNPKIESDVVVYGQCRTEIEGQVRPLFTLFGGHKDDIDVGKMATDIIQQMQAQLAPGESIPLSPLEELQLKGMAPIPSIAPPKRILSIGEEVPPPLPGGGFGIPQQIVVKGPAVRHVHKIEASIGIGVGERGIQVVRIYDVSMLDDAMVSVIEKAIMERLSSGDGFIDEFCLEFNGGYGCGPRLSDEEQFIRKQIKRQKREHDEESKWRGDGEDDQ